MMSKRPPSDAAVHSRGTRNLDSSEAKFDEFDDEDIQGPSMEHGAWHETGVFVLEFTHDEKG